MKTIGIANVMADNKDCTFQLVMSEYHALRLIEKLTQSILRMRHIRKARLAVNVFAVDNPFTYDDSSPTVSVLENKGEN